ncbi:MAG: tRNA1(Val) (adenine(37)-N6)-methyltransferase [bacterium]
MKYKRNNYNTVIMKIHQPRKGYRFSIDSILLSHFARPQKNATIIDIGCGVGIIGLILTSKREDIKVIGVEIQKELHDLALENIKANSLEDRMNVILSDIKDINRYLPSGRFQFVISNPPYIKPGRGRVPPDSVKAIAKSESEMSIDDLIKSANYLLKNRGRFSLIWTARRFAGLIYNLKVRNFEPKRIRFVHTYSDRKANLVLVEAVKNGGEELIIEKPLIIWNDVGVYTDEVLKMLK